MTNKEYTDPLILTTKEWTSPTFRIQTWTKRRKDGSFSIRGIRINGVPYPIGDDAKRISCLVVNNFMWIQDISNMLRAFAAMCLGERKYTGAKVRFLRRIAWEKQQLIDNMLVALEEQATTAFEKENLKIPMPLNVGEFQIPALMDQDHNARDDLQPYWDFRKILKTVQKQADDLHVELLKVSCSNEVAKDGVHASIMNITDGSAIPVQGSKELLVEIISRKFQDQVFNVVPNSDDKSSTSKLHHGNETEISKESLQDLCLQAKRLALEKHKDKTKLKACGDQIKRLLSKFKICMQRFREMVPTIQAMRMLWVDDSQLPNHSPMTLGTRHPVVIHICFCCGTTGATAERITTEFREFFHDIRQQRVKIGGKLHRQTALINTNPAAIDENVRDFLSMADHIGQAFNVNLEPIPGCETCRGWRRYVEVDTGRGPAYQSTKEGRQSGATSCAEYATMARCKSMEARVMGDIIRQPKGIRTATAVQQLATRLGRAVNASEMQEEEEQLWEEKGSQ